MFMTFRDLIGRAEPNCDFDVVNQHMPLVQVVSAKPLTHNVLSPIATLSDSVWNVVLTQLTSLQYAVKLQSFMSSSVTLWQCLALSTGGDVVLGKKHV